MKIQRYCSENKFTCFILSLVWPCDQSPDSESLAEDSEESNEIIGRVEFQPQRYHRVNTQPRPILITKLVVIYHKIPASLGMTETRNEVS